MNELDKAVEKISAQQPKERTPVWMVGEQLKDILRSEPHLAGIIISDLDVENLSLANCEKEIKAFADSRKSGGFSCVIPSEAEAIIREFYGLPKEKAEMPKPTADSKLIDLSTWF